MRSRAGRHVLQTNAVWTAGVRSVVADGPAMPVSEWSRAEWSPSEWSRTATTRTVEARHVAEPSSGSRLVAAEAPSPVVHEHVVPAAVASLAPPEAQPLPHRAELIRWAHTVVALLAHPYPHRAPKAPLTRDEHVALAQHEAAREARERAAYRDFALGRPIR